MNESAVFCRSTTGSLLPIMDLVLETEKHQVTELLKFPGLLNVIFTIRENVTNTKLLGKEKGKY